MCFINHSQNTSSYFQAEKIISPKAKLVGLDLQKHFINDGRLPGHVIPKHYNLTLQLFMPPKYNFTTKGKVQILFECLEDTKVITLHARDLQVEFARLQSVAEPDLDNSSTSSWKTNVSTAPEKQLVFIHSTRAMFPKRHYILDITFTGLINNLSVGLYRSSYKSERGNTSWIASTQFEPTDARRVFPCFDEPALKATFELHLIRDKHAKALANTPEQRKLVLDDEWECVTFEITPRMSTYILAFVVGDIISYNKPENGVNKVQIWSRTDMIQYGEHAHNVSPELLTFYNGYFEVPYSLNKTDLVAVPDFLHAAMENWGIIIFEESALLYDREKSPTDSKVFVTLVIAHELAHQWFGNLVTPAWWDNIWLNEGFATFYEYVGVDYLQPDWNITHLFIASIYEVMETDSLVTSRAMAAPVSTEEILDVFDEISYLKGGAIIRMLESFLGERNFRQGLKNYLWRYSFKNAREQDLWQNLNLWNRNELGVKQIMRTWTSQAGYPVVTITRNYENSTGLIEQHPFRLDVETSLLQRPFSDLDGGDSKINLKVPDKKWKIPLSFTNGKELDWSTSTDFWLTNLSAKVSGLPANDTWIIANVQQVGYYRVNYDRENWELLLTQLLENHKAIHVVNRAQIINDILNLARTDQVDYALALNMTKYLYQEQEYLPWQAAFSTFRYIDMMLSKTKAHKSWQNYVLTLMSPLYADLGWTNEENSDSVLTKFLRKNILKWNCNYGNEDCVNKSRLMFQEWTKEMATNVTIATDDQEVVLCTGIAKGTVEEWELMRKRYLKENFRVQKNIFLKSLACTKEKELLKKLLRSALDTESGIPLQDGSDVFLYVAENFNGRDVIYDFFKDHLEDITARFGSHGLGGSAIVHYATAALRTENEVSELASFMKRREDRFHGFYKAMRESLQKSTNNYNWMVHKYETVHRWLEENSLD
ncbi:thyrotropin-releasing hormone-degrading ectoenzyme-like [Uloborus diversus]|uniref:thyrotropin-releasing hormone-degrading ectoenzyme-like n=1 Tax=Uloborus diversus TaxID=327109 RepID=UPI00240998BF|nr:thyrotropin-releasing hormone-degrading ectoenzyme-like [Uloborus diversus]